MHKALTELSKLYTIGDMMRTFPVTETTFLLPGPAGLLELLAMPPKAGTSYPAVGIVCHPHSLHGGTIRNKVVTTIAKMLHDHGLPTVRFNFRGVGQSEGEYAQGIGEVGDVLAVLDWVKHCFPNQAIWLAGFSFGAYVSACAAMQVKIDQLISIAPPVSRFYFDFSLLSSLSCPWVIVQGEEDEVISSAEVFAWVESLTAKPTLIRVPGAGHFFHGRLLELRGLLDRALF